MVLVPAVLLVLALLLSHDIGRRGSTSGRHIARAALAPGNWVDGRRLGRPGISGAEKQSKLLALLVATSHRQSPLGWMPISSRIGSVATLDITDMRGHWTPHLPEQAEYKDHFLCELVKNWWEVRGGTA